MTIEHLKKVNPAPSIDKENHAVEAVLSWIEHEYEIKVAKKKDLGDEAVMGVIAGLKEEVNESC